MAGSFLYPLWYKVTSFSMFYTLWGTRSYMNIVCWKWNSKHADYTTFIKDVGRVDNELIEFIRAQQVEHNPLWAYPYKGEYQYEIWLANDSTLYYYTNEEIL